MSRPKRDPIDAALDAYGALTQEQRQEFTRITARLARMNGEMPKPPARKRVASPPKISSAPAST